MLLWVFSKCLFLVYEKTLDFCIFTCKQSFYQSIIFLIVFQYSLFVFQGKNDSSEYSNNFASKITKMLQFLFCIVENTQLGSSFPHIGQQLIPLQDRWPSAFRLVQLVVKLATLMETEVSHGILFCDFSISSCSFSAAAIL